MSNTWSLFKYELYKILNKKLTIIVLCLMIIATILMGLPLGQGPETKQIQKAMQTMDGKKLDNTLMKEINENLDLSDPDWNTKTWKYTGLVSIVSPFVASSDKKYTANDFYKLRQEEQIETMTAYRLNEAEISWWQEKENQIVKPFTYVSSYNARTLVDYMGNILLLSLLLSAICLSTVFAGEHRCRMDSLILSSKNGKRATYTAKLAAGFMFIMIWTIIFTAVLALTIFLTKGLSGMKAIVQMETPISAYPLTFLQFFGKQIIILITGSFLFAAIAMAFSLFLKKGIAVMGMMIGCYFVTQFVDIPKTIRPLSQFMAMIPTDIINLWTVHDHRLVKVFGRYYTMFSVAPIGYFAIAVILCVAGWISYRKYQVGLR